MARRQGKHSFEERDRLGHAAKKQVGGESILRNALGRGAAGEKCANLRSKRKAVRGLRVIKRLDAQWVARQEKNWRGGVALAEIEQRECEHAAQFGQRIFPPLFPGVNQNLRVRLRGKPMAAERKPLAQFAIVVQLAVEEDGDVLGFVPNGLVAARKIDDAQTAHAEREPRRARIACEKTFLIGAAMAHRGGHHTHARFRFGAA